ncbi:S1/P1 nuclease [Spirosoma flavum]|uniref:S1/P1 nuclease n=1 Tax=Spirosoma flavum TaxID=2048557 RepID=A0ABW6ARU9_9BACT
MNPQLIRARFSAVRHRTIAELADKFLEPTPRGKVREILKVLKSGNLKDIASWADDIKPTSKNKPTDSETKDFLNEFPDTREWHFVDLPVDAHKYDVVEYAAFTRPDDIVHQTVESINILTNNSTKFSKPNALRWLVHLVGDMHQPLHIACSYVDLSQGIPVLVFDKDTIFAKHLLQKSDKGGNNINLPIHKALHSYWDSDLPEMDNNFDNTNFDSPAPVPIGDLINLPAQWVSDNVKFAKEAYNGLTVKGANAKQPNTIDVDWDQNEYNHRCVPIIKSLSQKAASRLAFLLNTIYA